MKHVTANRYAAFTSSGAGGNPAGVVLIKDSLSDEFSPELMQQIAKEIGDSETVFAKEIGKNIFKVRYFSPEGEITFCGHATIALGASLRTLHGKKQFVVVFNNGELQLDAFSLDDIRFNSPSTHHQAIHDNELDEVKRLFGLKSDEIDMRWPPAIVNAGNDHVFIALKSRECLKQLNYNFSLTQKWMREKQYITIALAVRGDNGVIHIRNAFAYGGVYEDPATGAAAAAISGYLRDAGLSKMTVLKFLQGEDLGVPCQLDTVFTNVISSNIAVSGKVRLIESLQLKFK